MTPVVFNGKVLNSFVNDLFSDLPVSFKETSPLFKNTIPVNVKETQQSFVLHVMAPGFEKGDFKLNVDQKLLTISAEAKKEETVETDKIVRTEFYVNSFKRSFTLTDKVQVDAITAAYTNGVLVVTLPKKAEEKAAQLEIPIQ